MCPDMDTNTGFLIADASHPLISMGPVYEELILYNITGVAEEKLLASFATISGKTLKTSDLLCELSGGQKVILMACLALYSPASRIEFCDLRHSLDSEKYEQLRGLISSFDKEIRFG